MSGPTEPEGRVSARTNLFVMAAICAGHGSEPVKVRNLSAKGALIEGATLPQAGAQVRLCRADLNIDGEIIWCRGGRAGLRFNSAVAVADWLPQGPAKASQERVDRLVQEFKTSGDAWAPSPAVGEVPGETITAAEFLQLKAAIESLAEDLAADAAIVERHLSKLQTLDIVAQALGKLAAARG